MRRRYPSLPPLLAVVLVLFMVALSGCAGWSLLTPEQKARSVVDTLQVELERMFDTAKAYVDLHPEYRAEWQSKVVPAFDLANKALKDTAELAGLELITASEVRARVTPFINQLIGYLGDIGFFERTGG